MRAAVVHRYGGPEVVRVEEVADPVPGKGEVLVRVRAAAVTSGDARIRGSRFPQGMAPLARLAFGVRKPRRPILGGTFSGVIDAVGRGVDGFVVGDEVCGMNGLKMGTHAELVAVAATRLARKPPGVSHEDAAGVLFGGSAALHFLRDKVRVAPGSTVLVNGASGAIGTNAVQLAALLGATVTGVTSGPNAALVRELGADQVIDHTTQDLSAIPERFDVVFDTVGNLSIDGARALLRPGGRVALAVTGVADGLRARGNVVAGPAPERVEAFDHLLALVADGSLTVVIDQALGLDAIQEAHRRVDSGHKVGNVLVRP